jgi:hypothetical protein
MYLNDNKSTDDNGSAELFANHFETVFETYNDEVFSDFQNSDFNTISFTQKKVKKCLEKLDTKKAMGPDEIPNIFLKKTASSIMYPLSLIFNSAIAEGTFPEMWKFALISPIHKKGPKENIANYRPIAKLSCMSKVFESIITDEIFDAVNGKIMKQQHGFHKKRSTQSNLAIFSNMLHSNLDRNVQVDVLYTDFEKAFDKINLQKLLRKLKGIGIGGNLLRLIGSYLHNRSMSVVVNNSISRSVSVTSGVPQGSHLGPLLFNIFLNDVSSCFQKTEFLAYADDLKVWKPISSQEDASEFQSEIDSLSAFCNDNDLFLNVQKCKTVSFNRKLDPITSVYSMNGESLESVETVEDLGVIFDRTLKFETHIQEITKKAYKMLGFLIRTCKDFKNIKSHVLLFNSFVKSQLNYCTVAWNPIYQKYIDQIEDIQKKFVRYLAHKFNNGIDDTYEVRCTNFKLRSLQSIRTENDLLFLHKSLHQHLYSEQFLDHFVFSSSNRETRNPRAFEPPIARTNLGLNGPFYRMMSSSNNLELKLEDLNNPSIESFRNLISKIL